MVLTVKKAGLKILHPSNDEVIVENTTDQVMPICFFIVHSATLGLAGAIKQLISGS